MEECCEKAAAGRASLPGSTPQPAEQAEKWKNVETAAPMVTGIVAAKERWVHVDSAVTAQVTTARVPVEAAPHERESCLLIDCEPLGCRPRLSCHSRHLQVGDQSY